MKVSSKIVEKCVNKATDNLKVRLAEHMLYDINNAVLEEGDVQMKTLSELLALGPARSQIEALTKIQEMLASRYDKT